MKEAFLFFVLFLAPLTAAPLQIVSGPNSSGKIYVPIVFDGLTLRTFLDTGSAATLVANNSQFAAYPKMDSLRFKGAAAVEQSVDKIQLKSIRLDNLTLANPAIGRANFPRAETTLGIDVLARQPFSLSVKRKFLVLNPAQPAARATTLQVSAQGLLSIAMDVGQIVFALWDTGAGLTTIDSAFIEANPENFKTTKKFMHGNDGVGKPLLVQVFRAKKIVVGGNSFKDVNVVATDLSVLRQNISKDIYAVVGFNLIAKADSYFDAKTRLWHCEAN
jgi:hypothetical protein